jgi:glycosyltransferase involved in cell wall biosynthesis
MQKRITDVVNAMCAIVRNLPDVHCSVYGNGPARDQVAESLAKSTLASRVTLQEPVPVTKIQSVMLNHHVFLLLSTHEGLPVALLEAMACGLVPICVRNTPGVEEVVTDGSNGLLIPDRNPNSVVEAVRRLRDEPGLWDRLSRNARQTVSEKYAVDVENTKWERLLGDLQTRKTGDLRRVPWRVRLPVEPLAEMDIRSAPFKQRLRHRRRAAWMALRLALRPRARLRAWLARRRGAEKSATGEA